MDPHAVTEVFGGQTLTFVSYAESGAPGWGGLKAKTATETAVSGCHFRPAGTVEADGQTDVSTEMWKATCPPAAAVLAARPDGVVKHNSVEFRIDGMVLPKYDLDGTVHHVTVMCRRQAG